MTRAVPSLRSGFRLRALAQFYPERSRRADARKAPQVKPCRTDGTVRRGGWESKPRKPRRRAGPARRGPWGRRRD